MPTLDVSELNIVISILGAFIVLYGVISVKIKQVWYLGEALPAVVVGIILGPMAAKFLDSERWGSPVKDQTETITLGLSRIVIGVQLVMAGYQLPAKYLWDRWKEMFLVLIPVMTSMWFCTTGCVMLMVPNLTFLSALVIGSLVTPTDPVLSQAIAKGPFADKYVPRALREIISAEAGANDGFGFPFLFLATFLIRHAEPAGVKFKTGVEPIHLGEEVHRMVARSGEIGRLGGGPGKAVELWVVEGWLYVILLGVVVGAVIGLLSMFIVNLSLQKKWIDGESLLLMPTAIALFTIGVCGCAGLDDLLACFCAGAALNWNGVYLAETLDRHDEVNGSIDILLNFGGFMFIGMIMPWDEFNQPELTGITYGRLIVLGILVLLLRRIPVILGIYKLMPSCVKNWKEALFMGYFGPIGIGAVFYVEHTRHHLFPKVEEVETEEEERLLRAMGAVVYFLVLFSIVVHGLSIPLLDAIYRWRKIPPIVEEPVEVRPVSHRASLPNNAYMDRRRGSIIVNNRFSRPTSVATARTRRVIDGGIVGQFSSEDVERGLSDASSRTISRSRHRRERPLSQSTMTDSLEEEKNANAKLWASLDRGRPLERPILLESTLTWNEPPKPARLGANRF